MNTNLYLPTIKEIDLEISKMINERVVTHLERILRDVSDEYLLNYERLKEKYLNPIREVAHDLAS